MEESKIILNDDEIKIERLKNLLNIKNTIINHLNGEYAFINESIDLTKNKQFWTCDNGLNFSIDPSEGINFYHEFSRGEKGIILNYPLNGDFNLKFKLKYQTIVNFYLGTEHLINFRNKQIKRDLPLKTNVWHDMEFDRKDGVVSVKVDDELIKTLNLDQTLFIIRVYNADREVNIKEFHATIEKTPKESSLINTNESNFENRISHLESYVTQLANNQDVLNLKKDLTRHESVTNRTLDAYNYLFNNIYLDYELKPKKLLKYLHTLINEIIEFIGNVCKKYGLQYWLDYGNLLGAVRHGDYIPWDDDADVGLLREDYYKFEAVIEKEIAAHNLSDYLELHYHKQKFNNDTIETFMAVRFYHRLNAHRGRRIISNVDLFPYDYMKTCDETISSKITQGITKFRQNKLDNMDKDENLKLYYEDFNLSSEKADYMLVGVVESVIRPFVVETDKVFPLKEIQFGDKVFPCPNDTHHYLDSVYGDYMHIPKLLHRHKRMSLFRYNDNNEEVFEKCINLLKDANENFKF